MKKIFNNIIISMFFILLLNSVSAIQVIDVQVGSNEVQNQNNINNTVYINTTINQTINQTIYVNQTINQTINTTINNSYYTYPNTFWNQTDNQSNLSGSKSGSFDLSTTGRINVRSDTYDELTSLIVGSTPATLGDGVTPTAGFISGNITANPIYLEYKGYVEKNGIRYYSSSWTAYVMKTPTNQGIQVNITPIAGATGYILGCRAQGGIYGDFFGVIDIGNITSYNITTGIEILNWTRSAWWGFSPLQGTTIITSPAPVASGSSSLITGTWGGTGAQIYIYSYRQIGSIKVYQYQSTLIGNLVWSGSNKGFTSSWLPGAESNGYVLQMVGGPAPGGWNLDVGNVTTYSSSNSTGWSSGLFDPAIRLTYNFSALWVQGDLKIDGDVKSDLNIGTNKLNTVDNTYGSCSIGHTGINGDNAITCTSPDGSKIARIISANNQRGGSAGLDWEVSGVGYGSLGGGSYSSGQNLLTLEPVGTGDAIWIGPYGGGANLRIDAFGNINGNGANTISGFSGILTNPVSDLYVQNSISMSGSDYLARWDSGVYRWKIGEYGYVTEVWADKFGNGNTWDLLAQSPAYPSTGWELWAGNGIHIGVNGGSDMATINNLGKGTFGTTYKGEIGDDANSYAFHGTNGGNDIYLIYGNNAAIQLGSGWATVLMHGGSDSLQYDSNVNSMNMWRFTGVPFSADKYYLNGLGLNIIDELGGIRSTDYYLADGGGSQTYLAHYNSGLSRREVMGDWWGEGGGFNAFAIKNGATYFDLYGDSINLRDTSGTATGKFTYVDAGNSIWTDKNLYPENDNSQDLGGVIGGTYPHRWKSLSATQEVKMGGDTNYIKLTDARGFDGGAVGFEIYGSGGRKVVMSRDYAVPFTTYLDDPLEAGIAMWEPGSSYGEGVGIGHIPYSSFLLSDATIQIPYNLGSWGQAIIDGILNVTGNISSDGYISAKEAYHAGMYSSNITGTPGISLNATLKTINFTTADHVDGFSFVENSKLQLIDPKGIGHYQVQWHAQEDGTNNHVYVGYVFVNGIQQNSTLARAVGQASNAFDLNGFGFIVINNVNDNVTVRIADLSGTSTPTVYVKNINLVRIHSN